MCVVSATGEWKVTTIAGAGSQGHADGMGSQAYFNQPHGVAVDHDDNIIVTDEGNYCVRMLSYDRYIAPTAVLIVVDADDVIQGC